MKTVKKSDIILLITVVMIGIILLLISTFLLLGKGNTVVVKVNGEEYAKLPLNKDTELLIKTENGTNLLIIKDGKSRQSLCHCFSV